MRSKHIKVLKERYEFGSCFRTLAVILVSGFYLFQKKVSRSMPPTSHWLTGRKTPTYLLTDLLACWKARRLCQQQENILECEDRLLGCCGCIATKRLEQQSRSGRLRVLTGRQYRYCHAPVEQISASNTHCWPHRRTDNTFCCRPEPFE